MREPFYFLLVLSAELKRLFAYRVQFWFELVASSLVHLVVALAVWRAVFEASGVEVINGYSYNDMIVYVVVATFIGQAVYGTGMGTFARDIYDGAYTRYLIYPLSVFTYKFAIFFARTIVSFGQLLVAIIVLLLSDLIPAGSLSFTSLLLGLLFATLASWLFFLMIVAVESVAFWAEQAWSMSFMMQVVVLFFGGKLIPVDLFPSALQTVLNYLPFPLLIFTPTRLVLGDVSNLGEVLVLMLIWATILLFLTMSVVKRGTRRYSGVGI
jgi:ABC-2 type transport system permease protein